MTSITNKELLQQVEANKKVATAEVQKTSLPSSNQGDTIAKTKEGLGQIQAFVATVKPQLPKADPIDPEDDFEKTLEKLTTILMDMKNSMQTQSGKIEEQLAYSDTIAKFNTEAMQTSLDQQQKNMQAEQLEHDSENTWEGKMMKGISSVCGNVWVSSFAMAAGFGGALLLEAGSYTAKAVSSITSVIQLMQTADAVYEAPVAFAQASYQNAMGANLEELGKDSSQCELLQSASDINATLNKKELSSFSEFSKGTTQLIDLTNDLNQVRVAASYAVSASIRH